MADIRTIGRAAVLLVGCAPLAVVTTLLLIPFWSWIEATFALEAIGHSGPAAWCYWSSYGLWLAALAAMAAHRRRRRT
jgi:hypothetical protein